MGLRYTIRSAKGAIPGHGQVVYPRAPKEGTEYWDPKTGTRTVASSEKQEKQPAYSRGAANMQTSPRLRGLQGCIRNRMSGEKFEGKVEVMKEFNDTAKECRELLEKKGVPGGVPDEFRSSFNP